MDDRIPEDMPEGVEELSVVETGEDLTGRDIGKNGREYYFRKADVTEDDMKCALMMRRGMPVPEAIRAIYGRDLDKSTYMKYWQRANRGWYNKIRLNDMPDTVKADVRNMEVVTTRGDGVVERRPMTEKEMAEFIWKRSASVRVLTEIAEDEESKKMEKIAAVKELNAMHGYYAPTNVHVTIGLEDVVREVEERKRTFIMAAKYGATSDEPVYVLQEEDLENGISA